MSRKNYDNLTTKNLGSKLFRAFCILLMFTALTAWSVGGVYARYVSSAQVDSSANVANMGIELLEVKEHPIKADVKGDELEKMVKENKTHVLDTDAQAVTATEIVKVPYGNVNVPKDPFVKLKLNSTLSYELYLIVTESANCPKIEYKLTSKWEEQTTGNTSAGGKLYKYTGDPFTAGTTYDDEIYILEDNVIKIGLTTGGIKEFSITFQVYLKQVQSSGNESILG